MLSDRRKEKLLSEMQKLKMSIFDEVPYSIFDENRKSLITVLSFEDECAEHELKKNGNVDLVNFAVIKN